MSAAPSEMSATKIYVGRAVHNDKNVHVIAYQNTAVSRRPNCMILPFPAKEPMGKENIIDTTEFKNFLDDIVESTRIEPMLLGNSQWGCAGTCGDGLAEVFDSGSYTVVLASKPGQIKVALERVPEHKRPTFTTAFLLSLHRLYPNHSFAVCCWAGSIAAEPLLWWYEPSNPDVLFFPTMDAHDGEPPNEDATVGVGHNLVTGVTFKPEDYPETNDFSSPRKPKTIRYTNKVSKVEHLLPKFARGAQISGYYPNGDILLPITELENKYPTVNRMNKGKINKSIRLHGWY